MTTPFTAHPGSVYRHPSRNTERRVTVIIMKELAKSDSAPALFKKQKKRAGSITFAVFRLQSKRKEMVRPRENKVSETWIPPSLDGLISKSVGYDHCL